MKPWLILLDRLIHGKTAAALAVAGAAILAVMLLQPLPWRHFPNIFKVFMGSWLYLVIAGAMISSALYSVAAKRGFPIEMAICIIVGIVWRHTNLLDFLPFNFSRLLIIYGLAGVTAHCLRRIRSRGAVAAPVPQAAAPPLA